MSDTAEHIDAPLFMQVKKEDFRHIDIDITLADVVDAELYEIEQLLRSASEDAENGKNLSAARAFAALSAAANLHFTAENHNEPFSAMVVMKNGRSAIPDDFLGEPLAAIEGIAQTVSNTALRARLCDLVWLLKRSNYQSGAVAASSYHKLVLGVRDGVLQLRNSDQNELGIRCQGFLRRALSICRGLKNPEEVLAPIAATLLELSDQALTEKHPFAVMQFSKLCLEFDLLEYSVIASNLEEATQWEEDASHKAKLWSLASNAYHWAKDDKNKWRCRVECAECYVRHADDMGMAMLKSRWLSTALAAYHGIPDQRARRTELRHQLIDEQAHINEEMTQFSQPMDLTKLVEMTKESFESTTAFEKLGLLANVHQSADPETLKAEAIKQIQEHPLSSIFGKTQHDSDGKVVHKSEGGGFADSCDGAVIDKISESQTVMRNIVVGSAIEPFLYSISGENFPSGFDLNSICENSPFIPVDRQYVFYEGIRNFLFGNQLVALNLLVPQLENSIRHILKQNDFDPTSFDEATQIQEDRPLTAIYQDMRAELEQCFGSNIVFEIEHLFLRKSGPNIRNEGAHGLMSDGAMSGPDATYANWFIYRLCCIPLLPHWKEIDPGK